MVPASANGQPAAAAYHRQDGHYQAFAVVVLTVTETGVSRVTVFANPDPFEVFVLRRTLNASKRPDAESSS